MNVREMIYNFGIQLNQFDSALILDTDDILWWLNRAQDTFIKRRYDMLDPLKRKARQEQNLFDDIRAFVVKNYEAPVEFHWEDASINGVYEEKANLPDNYMHLLSIRSVVQYAFPQLHWTKSGNKRVPVEGQNVKKRTSISRFSQTDDIYELLSDPFNQTDPTSPLTDVNEGVITVYSNKTFVVNNLIINYLRRPKLLSTDNVLPSHPTVTNESEFPEHTHEEIIDLAVTLFLMNTRELKQRENLQRETPVAGEQQSKQQIEEQ